MKGNADRILREGRFFEVQKIEIAKNGRSVFFFHRCAAHATRVISFDGSLRVHNDFDVVGTVGAMPALTCFHDHGRAALSQNIFLEYNV
jgi:hypothetical protein